MGTVGETTTTIARVGVVVALAAAIAGCSPGATEPTDAASVATSAAPAAARPLSDFTDGPFYSFGTPSGQIQCRVVDGTLACQTQEHPHTVAEGALCGFYPGVEQGETRRFGYLEDAPNQPCATIIQGDGFDSPHTLAYGQSVTAELSAGRTVTCTSAVEGLTCTQTGGTGARGFFLSIDSFTVL